MIEVSHIYKILLNLFKITMTLPLSADKILTLNHVLKVKVNVFNLMLNDYPLEKTKLYI